MMMVARDVLPELAPAFTFDVVDAARLPFEDASFDVVIANHMLYHVEDRPRAFREICRVLKPGGCLYASTVGEQHMLELWSWVEQVHPGIIAWTRGAVAGFTLENGRGQLAPYFSKVILTRYQDELHVTEVEPLVAYVQSVIEGSRFALSDVRLAAFRNLVQQRLQRRGYLRIGKAVGLFTAASPTL
jgi:ubiquinone/menaquinone biosynthesis C-methylase UbiE